MFEEDGKMERGRDEGVISFAGTASNTVCHSCEKYDGALTSPTSAKGKGLFLVGKMLVYGKTFGLMNTKVVVRS